MNKWRFFTLLFVSALMLAAMCASLNAQNLLENGDFEGAWNPAPPGLGDWVGQGWTGYTNPLGPTQESASGDPALWAMPNNDGQIYPESNSYQRIIGGNIRSSNFRGGIQQVVSTTPSGVYDLSLHAKMLRTNISNFNIHPNGRFGYDLTGQTSNGSAATIVWFPISEADAWSHYSVRFTATGPTVSIWIEASLPEATATLHLDVDNVIVASAAGTGVINITDGPHFTQLSDTTFQIDWETDIPSSSVVEYGPMAPNADEGLSYPYTATTPGLVYSHSVVLSALNIDDLYHYRVLSSASGYKTVYSTNHTFRTPPPAQAMLTNGSFEIVEGQGPTRTAPPWKSFPVVGGGDGGDQSGIIGPYLSTGTQRWLGLVRAQNGSYFAGAAGQYDRKQGGFYQRVQAVPGMTYTASCYLATYANGGSPWDTMVWIGIDPKGGVDPGPEPDPNNPNPMAPWITWSTDDKHSGNVFPIPWVTASVEAVAESNVITVFIRFQQKWQLQMNVTAVDNITLQGPPAEAMPVQTIGEAKDKQDYAYVDMVNGSIVTLVPLMESGFFYAQDEDGTAGIRVESSEPVTVGDKVRIKGILRTNPNGERVLRDTTVTAMGTGETPIRNVRNKDIGGERFVDGSGLSNEGLLVRAFGEVTKMDWFEGYYLIDDGSMVDSGEAEPGIKVILTNAFPNPGDFISIVGVVTSEVSNGKTIRVLRGREFTVPSDFQPIAP